MRLCCGHAGLGLWLKICGETLQILFFLLHQFVDAPQIVPHCLVYPLATAQCAMHGIGVMRSSTNDAADQLRLLLKQQIQSAQVFSHREDIPFKGHC